MRKLWNGINLKSTFNKKFTKKSINEQLQNINSKLGAISGNSTTRSENQRNFEKMQELVMGLQNKTDYYFYITICW